MLLLPKPRFSDRSRRMIRLRPEARVLCIYVDTYPACLKKFQHSWGVKRSQMSASAWQSWSNVLAPMRRR